MANFRRVADIACKFFTAAVLIYVGALAFGVTNAAGSDNVYSLLFRNIAVLFGFSCALGTSSLILKTKLSPAAARVLHALTVFVAYIVTILVMANPGKDARQIVIFLFIATLLYVIVYVASLLVIKLIGKIKEG